MQIGSVSQGSTSNQTQNTGGTISKQDPRIKAIQNQIENVRKQLNELSANENMSAEQKKERRKQLNEQMKQLNERLSQTQMEIQRENMKKSSESKNENSGNDSTNVKSTGFSEDIVTLDLSLKQMESLESVKNGMKGYSKILKSQIKQDADRGVNTEKKEKELSDLERGIYKANKKIGEKAGEINEKKTDEEDENKEEKKEKENFYSVDIRL